MFIVHGIGNADNGFVGNITGAAHKEASNMRKAGDNCEAGSYSNSFGGSEQIRSVADERIEYMGNSQHHQSNSPRICVNAFKGEGGTYEKQERIQRENSTDSYHSNTSQHTPPGHNLRENVWLRKSESVNAESNQRPSSQVWQKCFYFWHTFIMQVEMQSELTCCQCK